MAEKDKFKIVFMGTPEFGATILETLIKHGYNIIGVFSQPDKPKGRGLKLSSTPVKSVCLKYDLPVFQPDSVNKGEGFKTLLNLNPNIIITAAYGKILKKKVLDLPQKGCWNVHASLLPKYRGAAPIQRAIENGEKETGITIFKMIEALDAGDIAIQKSISIDIDDNFEAVYNKLINLAKETVLEFLERFDSVILEPQNEKEVIYAEKITQKDLKVDFNWKAEKVHNKIRAYDPVPGSFALINNEKAKIFGSKLLLANLFELDNKYENGIIFAKDEEAILVKCKDGAVKIKEIQFPNKKRISTIDAVNGRKIKIGDKFY